MDELGRLILITGTPAVGKTTISRLLATKLNAIHVNLTELVKEEGLTVGIDEVRKTLIADTDKISNRVRRIVDSSEQDVIIDGHYAVEVVSSRDIEIIFVLRRNPDELKILMEKRGFIGRKLWENLAAEILDVALWDAASCHELSKVCEIDVSKRTATSVVEDMISVLKGKRKCKVGIVDWLGKLDAEGRLHDFLRNF